MPNPSVFLPEDNTLRRSLDYLNSPACAVADHLVTGCGSKGTRLPDGQWLNSPACYHSLGDFTHSHG